jgi:adenylate cyclase
MATARRLSAIMFTDMVDFTAHTQADEQGTLRLLREQEEIVGPLIGSYGGRLVKSTGDGFLAEFPSALQAVECAIAVQERLRSRNALPGVSVIELRIGIHLGDVEQRGTDIFGDAVNLAARVQTAADSSGIAISQQVLDQVRNKLARSFEKLSPTALKGIRVPVDLYRVGLEEPRELSTRGMGSAGDESRRIAVLPFANISPDPNDTYFSEGLTEEVISVLSQLRSLRVIARTSVEPYRSSPKPIPQVARELGVRWILEGSVRKSGSRLRITTQLIDAATQEHRWAETYDRELVDVFEVQSEMAKRVAAALEIQLISRETSRLDHRSVPKPDSYLEYLQGRAVMRGLEQANLRAALQHFERAVELDEQNAAAHAGLSDVHLILGGIYRHIPREEWRKQSRIHALRAVELDPELAEAHTSLANVFRSVDDIARAQEELRMAITLNPSLAWARVFYADLLADMGQEAAALQEFELARKLDPNSAIVAGEHIALLVAVGHLDEARGVLDKLGELDGHGIMYMDRRADFELSTGDIAGFRKSVERFEALLPGRSELLTARAMVEAFEGRPDGARELLKEAEALSEPERPDSGIATTYAVLGDLDACFRWLEVARANGRFTPRHWRFDSRLARVRADPRFGELLRRMNLA